MTKKFTIQFNEEQIDLIKRALDYALEMAPVETDEDRELAEEAQLMVDMIDTMKRVVDDAGDYDVNTVHAFWA